MNGIDIGKVGHKEFKEKSPSDQMWLIYHATERTQLALETQKTQCKKRFAPRWLLWATGVGFFAILSLFAYGFYNPPAAANIAKEIVRKVPIVR